MEKESNRREFLRKASLAGMGLVAGCCGKEKERVKELEAQIAVSQASTQAVHDQVEVDSDGNLVILDEKVRNDLWAVWKRQESANKPEAHCSPKGDHPPQNPNCSKRKGIHVVFEPPPSEIDPTKPPSDNKVNSLCSC